METQKKHGLQTFWQQDARCHKPNHDEKDLPMSPSFDSLHMTTLHTWL
jgi:hypothetical protein